MQLNASALNAVALNAPARQALFAVAMLAAGVSVGAEALVTKYPQAQLDGGFQLEVVAAQQHASAAEFSCDCNVVAVNPRQTFASSSVVVTAGSSFAQADVTRYCAAAVQAVADVLSAPYVTHGAAGALSTSGAVSAAGTARLVGSADVSGLGQLVAQPKRTTFSGANVQTSGSLLATAGIAQKAAAAIPVQATVIASAGYAKPSASIVLSGAQLYAYARVNRISSASMRGSCSASAAAKLDAWGVANMAGFGLLSAWSVQEQGWSAVSGSSDVSATATYEFMSAADALCQGVLSATPTREVFAYSQVLAGRGTLRPEASLNNLHDGYALPVSTANVTISASGVVVSPAVSHIDVSCEVSVRPTYRYSANAASACVASCEANGTKIHPGEASVTASATPQATAHFLWAGEAQITAASPLLEVVPNQRHTALPAQFSAGAEIAAVGTAVRRSQAASQTSGHLVVSAVAVRMAKAAPSSVAILAATANTKHAASGSVQATASVVANGVRVQHGSAQAAGSAQLGSDPEAKYTASAHTLTVGELGAEATRIALGDAAITTESAVSAKGWMKFSAHAKVDAGSGVELIAYLLGNAVARDPEERTMRRVGVDRVMRRPFVDRTMKAVRA